MKKMLLFLMIFSLCGCKKSNIPSTTFEKDTMPKEEIIFEEIEKPIIKYEPINITKRLIGKNTKARPGIIREVKWIVIHETGNKKAGAINHALYLENNTNQSVSWHYTVDANNVINHIPDEEVAWHAGDGLTEIRTGSYLGGGNLNGIGIEMCVNDGNDMNETYHNTARLVAELLLEYNMDPSRVKKHQDFSGKICPQNIIENGLWDDFMSNIESEYILILTLSKN